MSMTLRPAWSSPVLHRTEVPAGLLPIQASAPSDRLVVGIIGGMGPAATGETFRRIVAATPAQRDQDHLHVIVDSDPLIPDRTAALLHGGADPRPRLVAAARRLEASGAQMLCMPCNTAHAYHTEIQAAVSVPLVDMVLETARMANRLGPRHGLLATAGTVLTGVFHERFRAVGGSLMTPDQPGQEAVTRAIAIVKAGGDLGAAADLCRTSSAQLLEQGASHLVLGCTELSLLATRLSESGPVIDALDVMVNSVVRAALRRV